MFQLPMETNLAFPQNRKSPPVCLDSAWVPLAEDTKSNTPKCEKETTPEHFVGFVTSFSRVPLPTHALLVLPLPVVCVYIKADQLSVCFSTGSYRETYAARGFQMAALPKWLPPSLSPWSGCTTLAAGTETPPLSPRRCHSPFLPFPLYFLLHCTSFCCCSFLLTTQGDFCGTFPAWEPTRRLERNFSQGCGVIEQVGTALRWRRVDLH